MRNEGKKVQYDKSEWITPPSKQLIVDWITVGVNAMHEINKLNVCIISGYAYITQSETDIRTIFDDEYDDQVFLELHSKRYHCCYNITNGVIWQL